MAKKGYDYLDLSDEVCTEEGCRKRIKRRLVETTKKPLGGRKCYKHYMNLKKAHKLRDKKLI